MGDAVHRLLALAQEPRGELHPPTGEVRGWRFADKVVESAYERRSRHVHGGGKLVDCPRAFGLGWRSPSARATTASRSPVSQDGGVDLAAPGPFIAQ